MRRLLVLALGFSSVLAAQQPAAAPPAPTSSWDAVRALRPGASLDIKLRHGYQKCAFRSADADTLSCNRGMDLSLHRADVLQIKVHHRGRSAFTGLAIGAGTGAVTGAATTKPCSSNSLCVGGGRGVAAVVYGLLGGAAGALTGYLSDFTHSTVYKAP